MRLLWLLLRGLLLRLLRLRALLRRLRGLRLRDLRLLGLLLPGVHLDVHEHLTESLRHTEHEHACVHMFGLVRWNGVALLQPHRGYSPLSPPPRRGNPRARRPCGMNS